VRIKTGSDSRFYAVPNMNDGNWHNNVVSVNSGVARVYLDGVESLAGAQTNNTSININTLGTFNGGSFYFNNKLDEIAIWVGTSATSQNAIDLYNGGNGALASSVIASPTAYWRMNGTSGDSTAIDEQGTYNGTLNNFNTATCWVAH